MRIAWFTPLSQSSGVSKYSVSAASALAVRHEVEVWTTPRPDDLPVDLSVRRIAELATGGSLEGYDAVIYNIGNNPDMHSDIYDVAMTTAGVVILHDKVMSHFMRVYYTARGRDSSIYADLLRHYYGPEAAACARQHALGLVAEDNDVPFVEPALANALGVIVHSEEAAAVANRYGGLVPLEVIDHPFYLYGDDPPLSRSELGLAEDAFVVVTHGRLGESKRIESLLTAASMLPTDVRATLRVVVVGGGHPGYERHLRSEARRLGVSELVIFTGALADREMLSYLAAADVFVNLRFPSTESASGSLIEQMRFGKPVIVSDIGFYASIPADVVVHTPPGDSGEAIAGALGRLMADDAARAAYASRVQRYASARFDRARYAQAIERFLVRVHESSGRLSAVDRLADELLTIPAGEVRRTIDERIRVMGAEEGV